MGRFCIRTINKLVASAWHCSNRPISQIPQNSTLEQKCAHFCSNVVYFGIWHRCIMGMKRFIIYFSLLKANNISNPNTLRPEQNGRHFADISTFILSHENHCIFMQICSEFVPKRPIHIKSQMIQVMACCLKFSHANTFENVCKMSAILFRTQRVKYNNLYHMSLQLNYPCTVMAIQKINNFSILLSIATILIDFSWRVISLEGSTCQGYFGKGWSQLCRKHFNWNIEICSWEYCRWWGNVGSGNGLVMTSNKPLPNNFFFFNL